MLKKYITAAFGIFIISVSMLVSAAVDVSVNPDTQKITVSGSGGIEISGQMLTMYCIREGTYILELEEEADSVLNTDLIEAIGYTVADENGNYVFPEVSVKGSTGKYIFYVNAYNRDEPYVSKPKSIADESTVDDFINSISGKSADEILGALTQEENSGLVGIDLSLYKLLNQNGKRAVAEKTENRNFSSISEIENALNVSSAQVGVMCAADAGALDKFICPELNGLPNDLTEIIKANSGIEAYKTGTAMEVFLGQPLSERTVILENALKLNRVTVYDVIKNIEICTINFEFSSCSGYGDITAIIEKHHADVISTLNLNAYKGNQYLNDLNKSLLTKSFSSADELVSYITNYKPSQQGNSGGTGGGAGGGGGSFSGNSGSGSGGGGSFSPNAMQNFVSNKKTPDFRDMKGYEWANDAVNYLYEKGVISGKSENSFSPQQNVTREEFVKMIVLAFSLYDANAKHSFNDFVDGAWYESFIASAYNNGIVKGVSGSTFGIGTSITRQDVAVIVARAKKAPENIGENAGFSDESSIADYARSSVKWMKDKGYLSGYEDGSFKPNFNCTRAEAAKIIYETIR